VPLDKETVDQIKGALKKARAAEGHFAYCVSGEDGEPVLMLRPRKIPGAAIAALKRSARKKKFVRGTVSYDKETQEYVFSCLAAPLPQFSRDLKRVFARQIAPLRGARVELAEMSDEERKIAVLQDARETASEAEGGESDLRAEAERLSTLLAVLEDQEKSARLTAEAELGWFATEEDVQAQREARRRLAKLAGKRKRTQASLADAREDMAAAADEAATARAESDALLVLWDREQQVLWDQRRDGTDPESVRWRADVLARTATYARAALEHDKVTEAISPIREEHEHASALAQRGHEDIEALEGEQEALAAELSALEDKEPFTTEDAERLSQLEMQDRTLQKRIATLTAAVRAAQEAVPGLEDELYILSRRLEHARVTRDIAEAHQQMQIATHAEGELRSVLTMELIDAEGTLRQAEQKLSEATTSLAEEERDSRERLEADAALREAQLTLHAVQIERQRAQELAETSSWGGWWEDAEKISAAQAALAGLQAQEAAALATFRDTQRRAEQARRSDKTDTDALVDAREEQLDAQLEVASGQRRLARLKLEHTDEDARLAAVSADLGRRARDARITALTKSSPALQDAQAELTSAQQGAADAQQALGRVDEDIARTGTIILQIRAQLRAGAGRRAEIRLLEDLREQLALLGRLEHSRERASDVLEAALELQIESSDALAEQIQVAGAADAELGQLLDAVGGSERMEAAAQQQSADALRALAEADVALAEIERRTMVVDRQTHLQELVSDEETQALLLKFHHMEDAADVTASVFVIDLLDEADREKAQLLDGYQDLMALQAKLESRALSMLRAGATAEELDAAFAQIPNGLRPPAYRAEVAAFVTLDQAFDMTDEEKDEARVLDAARGQVLIEERKAEAIKKLRALSADGDAVAAARIALNKPEVDEDPTIIDNVVSALGSIESAIRTAEAGTVETLEDLHEVMADSLIALKRANLDIVAVIGPALTQLLGPARATYEAAMEASVRRGRSRYTALLGKAAKVSGSPLAGAFEEAVAQERELWASYSVDASLSAVQVVARLTMQFPGTTAMGAALELGAFTGRSISDAAFTLSGWRTAQKAKDLLEEARAGSEAARVALFKTHPLYAKGLIAFMSRQDDPFARSYVALQVGDVEAADRKIKSDSLRILTHYLLKSADQIDVNGDIKLETAAEWCERQRARLTESITSGFKGISATIDRWREIERYDDARLAAVQDNTHQLASARAAALRLQARYANDESVSDIQQQAIAELLERYRDAFAATRREAMSGLAHLELLQRQAAALARHEEDTDDATKAAAARLETAVPRLRERYLDIVGVLAKSA
jgi:hypothetical protein